MSVYFIVKAIYRYYFRPGPKWLLFTYAMTIGAALVIVAYGWKRKKGVKWCICMVILFFYLLTVLTSTVLSRTYMTNSSVNFNLFWSWKKAFSGSIDGILVLIENIILLAPIGFLLPFINEKIFKVLPTIILGFCFCMVIEVSQMLLQRGMFELDDIMNNTIGVILGYVMAKVILKVHRVVCDARR